jgi:hypothetical protein
MSGNTQEKNKNGVQIMRDLFYGIKEKQKPTPELNEAVKHRRPVEKPGKSSPEGKNKTPERKIARPKPREDLGL